MARRLVKEGGRNPTAITAYGFRLCVSRPPAHNELDRILTFYGKQLEHFRSDAKAAAEVAHGADAPDAAETAAWTMVSNVLLNLDAAITKD